MPIKLPDLDDRSYTDLVAEAMTSIPTIYPAWTDHNPSNPGIALIELFAWLTDVMVYRTNLITETNQWAFVKLLRGPTWTRPEGLDIETAIRDAVVEIRERYRAVTQDDYEYLTLNTWPTTNQAQTLGTAGMVARAHCLEERNVNETSELLDAPGYVTLLVVPDSPDFQQTPPASWVDPDSALTNALATFFEDRKLITTRLRVRGPCPVAVDIEATVYLKDDARKEIRADIENALCRHFHPWKGGIDGRGWPLGRSVYPSDVYSVLEHVGGIDFVEAVAVKAQGSPEQQEARKIDEGGEIAVKLHAHELVKLEPSDIVVTLMERRGDKWLLMSA